MYRRPGPAELNCCRSQDPRQSGRQWTTGQKEWCCSEGINLGLLRDPISYVYRACLGDAPPASVRSAWVETQISPQRGRAGVGYRRGTQNREALRRTQQWRRH